MTDCRPTPLLLLAVLLLAGCVGHAPPTSSPHTTTRIGPYPAPKGRILLLGRHRAQLRFSCTTEGDTDHGYCRFVHPASARIVELRWRQSSLALRDNAATPPKWRITDMGALRKLGIIVAPAVLMRMLRGTIPAWLHPVAANRWQGWYSHSKIQVRWTPDEKALELRNLSSGDRIRLLLHR